MSFESRRELNNSVHVRAVNRPIRIVYLIPYEESDCNHSIIDAVFYECYTRWAGGRTLIIPTYDNKFLHEEYQYWLEFYDPDFIYSYLELKQEFIEKINAISSPIVFIKHKNRNPIEANWRNCVPEWDTYFKPVSSLSTLNSPFTTGYHRPVWFNQKEATTIPTLITQYEEFDKQRFVPDNFGVAFDPIMYPNPVNDLFDTLCFTPNDVPKHMIVGTNKTTSIIEILSQIRQNKALPIAMLAMAHSKSVPLVGPYSWAHQFNLFIGHTCLDRIHFWNARNLCPAPGALLIKQEQLQNDDFIKEIGQFLNNCNFIGQNNGPAQVAIRSFTHSKEELITMKDKLNKGTFNNIFLNEQYNAPALPMRDDFKKYYGTRLPDVTTFKISENINELQVKEPEHFTFTPSRFQSFNRGQWIVELEIERHNNLSKYSNVVDTWMLPRRHSVVNAFTKNLARVTRDYKLALLPSTDDFPLLSDSIKNTYSYQLLLPDDENFFRRLLLDDGYLLKEDLRSMLSLDSYKDMKVSDKGQNLRGVISMFDHHSEAAEILTNRYWRDILRTWNTKQTNKDKDNDDENKNDNNKFYNLNHFKGRLPSNEESKKMLMSELRLKSKKDASKYLEANLTDTLELLIRKRVFFRVYQWRCSYCGHANTRTFEDMNETNNCSICSKKHFAPIDIEWKYELNNFIFRSLCEHNGLTVLWALSQLHERSIAHSFYYLPEVDLYNEYNRETKNEIDVLCVKGGRFYAIEVKLSAINFIEKQNEINNFTEEINLIRPDVALLVFEQYCESENDVENTKVKLKKVVECISESVGEYIKVETLIASEFTEFINYPVDLGYWGKRVYRLFDTIEKKEIANNCT